MGLPLVSGICIMLEINKMFKIAYSLTPVVLND